MDHLAFTISDSVFWGAIAAVILALWGAVKGLYSRFTKLTDERLAEQGRQILQLQQDARECKHDRQILFDFLTQILPTEARARILEIWNNNNDTHIPPDSPEAEARLQLRRERKRQRVMETSQLVGAPLNPSPIPPPP